MNLKLKKLLVVSSVALGSMMTHLSATAETVTLTYNQWFPSQHWSQKDGLYKYFEEIEKATEGRVVVRPSAKPLAPPTKNYLAVVNGIADIAWGPHGYTPGAFPLTEMAEFPFQTVDAGISSKAYWRLYKKYFENTGMQEQVVTLAMHVTSGGNLHMREDLIQTADDLDGKKIRVPTSVVGKALKDMGAVPISGSLSELREFLSRGIVDGTAISDELVTGFKVDNYINKVTQIPGGIYSNSAFVILNKAKWEKISKADQEAIMALSGEALSERMGALWHANDVIARNAMKARLGSDYIVADDALLDALSESFAPIETQWLETAKSKGIDGQAAIDFYRAEVESLSK